MNLGTASTSTYQDDEAYPRTLYVIQLTVKV